MTWRKSGLQALWVLVPSQSPSLTWVWTPLSFAEGWFWNLPVKSGGWEGKPHISWGARAKGGEQAHGSCSRTILPGAFSRGENICAHKLFSKIRSHLDIDVPVHLVSGIGLGLYRVRAFSGTFSSLSPSLPPFLPFFFPPSLIFLRQFSPSLSSAVFHPNSDMGYRYTEKIIFSLKSISARRFLHRFSAKPAWAANPLVDQITLMLKAAFELAEYSSQGQRLNYPLQ